MVVALLVVIYSVTSLTYCLCSSCTAGLFEFYACNENSNYTFFPFHCAPFEIKNSSLVYSVRRIITVKYTGYTNIITSGYTFSSEMTSVMEPSMLLGGGSIALSVPCPSSNAFPPTNCIWLTVFTTIVEFAPFARFTSRAPASFMPMSKRPPSMQRSGAPPTTENRFATEVFKSATFEAILQTQQKIVLMNKKILDMG